MKSKEFMANHLLVDKHKSVYQNFKSCTHFLPKAKQCLVQKNVTRPAVASNAIQKTRLLETDGCMMIDTPPLSIRITHLSDCLKCQNHSLDQ